jgi:hypothetical protein
LLLNGHGSALGLWVLIHSPPLLYRVHVIKLSNPSALGKLGYAKLHSFGLHSTRNEVTIPSRCALSQGEVMFAPKTIFISFDQRLFGNNFLIMFPVSQRCISFEFFELPVKERQGFIPGEKANFCNL